MIEALTAEQMESYDRTASRRCAGIESMTFWGTPHFRFQKNERSLLRAGFLAAARCRHRGRSQTNLPESE